MFFYRGYAYSDKKVAITEDAIKIDAQAILDYCYENKEMLGSNLYLMGKSFGAAVATYTATELQTKSGEPASDVFMGLILEAGFTTAHDAIKLRTSAPLCLFNKI
jgi:predicted alpha/beta-fold hydrolase